MSYERLVRTVKDHLLMREIMSIKSELREVQRLLSRGDLRAAEKKLEDLVFWISNLRKDLEEQDVNNELSLAEWHLERALNKISKIS